MKRAFRLIPLTAVLCLVYAQNRPVDPASYLDDVKYLASPELKGRAAGSPEADKAAEFIAGKYKSFGVNPAPGHGYLQRFMILTETRLGQGNRFTVTRDGRRSELKVSADYIPFGYSSSGKLNGNVVFAGYGITAPEYH